MADINFPTSPNEGDTYTFNNITYKWANTQGVWQTRLGPGLGFSASATAPANPSEGQRWMDTDDGVLYTYYDGAWVQFGGGGGGGGGASVELSDSAPATTTAGSLWVRTTDFHTFVYYNDGNSSQWVDITTTATSNFIPQGYLYGMELSNNGTDSDHDIDIAAGEAASDDTSPILLSAGAMTKQADVAWTAGTAAGGSLDSGTLTASGTVHWWAIGKNDGTVDFACSDHDTSGLSPTLPTGYTYKRRIGSLRLDASSNILPFFQFGDEFVVVNPVADYSSSSQGTTKILRNTQCPEGIQVRAKLSVGIYLSGQNPYLYVGTPNLTTTPGIEVAQIRGNTVSSRHNEIEVWTNTSAQVESDASVASCSYWQGTTGWTDHRGRIE